MLVTGPTGSGKSTTLAALMQYIADQHPVHVITIEDPIEFLLHDDAAPSPSARWAPTRRASPRRCSNALRQDPDVIMVGEMRDPETVSTVITAAETGHLVFSTLHTNDTAQTVDRILDTFPPDQQTQVRFQLAQVLKGVVSMKLVERRDGSGPDRGARDPAHLARRREDDRDRARPPSCSSASSPRSATTACSR